MNETRQKIRFVKVSEKQLGNIPIGYFVEGYLLSSVEVGKPVEIERLNRNGVDKYGYFRTSLVQSVEGNLIVTNNSTYSMVDI